MPLLSTLAWACLEAGEVARAEHLAQRAVAQAEGLGAWFQGVSALRIQGLIAARLDRFDAAEAAYREGLRRARAMPFPYGEAQLLHASGSAPATTWERHGGSKAVGGGTRYFSAPWRPQGCGATTGGHPRGLTGRAATARHTRELSPGEPVERSDNTSAEYVGLYNGVR